MKRVLSALLVLMLVLALLPASALAETPYTRADAAVYLAETFGLADIHASRIEGYETTPKEMGYSASSDAITAANVIAAAKDCVDLPTDPKIEAVINAQLLSLADDHLSFRPDAPITVREMATAVAKALYGADLKIDHLQKAIDAGLLKASDLTDEPITATQVETLFAFLQDMQVVSVFATADIHGNYIPYTSSDGKFEIGSVARIKTVMNEVEARLGEDHVIYVDGGDSPYNTTLANVSMGNVSVDALSALGLDATVLGNHDFDYSLENLLRLRDRAQYAMLSANTKFKEGKAYVDDLTREEMQEYRGNDAGKPSRPSPYRDRTPEENLDLFRRMRAGEFADGEKTLRAKIDLASPNMNMRDPTIYRIKHVEHHRQGDKWCIYPMYDFAHPIQDAIEGITFSLCSLEFENHRPLYEWVITNLFGKEFPKQREFARLNVTNTVMSKRYLRELVEKNIVDGWDDPRMPTLSGLRRRGYTPTSIFTFVKEAGISKADNLVDMRQLEAVLRAELELNAQRRVAVLEPVKLIIDNYPADQCDYFDLPNNPNRDANDTTTRKVAFTKELWIENSDFFEVPPPKFKRLTLGSEVRLMGAYLVRCTGVDKDENGKVVAIHAEADLETRNGNPADGRKVRGTIHWVSCAHCLDAEVELYDKLFTEANMNSIPDDADFKDYLNPDSVKVLQGAKLEESLKDAKPGDRFQFVRNGYFTPDSKHEGVYNRIVTLKDSFKL